MYPLSAAKAAEDGLAESLEQVGQEGLEGLESSSCTWYADIPKEEGNPNSHLNLTLALTSTLTLTLSSALFLTPIDLNINPNHILPVIFRTITNA